MRLRDIIALQAASTAKVIEPQFMERPAKKIPLRPGQTVSTHAGTHYEDIRPFGKSKTKWHGKVIRVGKGVDKSALGQRFGFTHQNVARIHKDAPKEIATKKVSIKR